MISFIWALDLEKRVRRFASQFRSMFMLQYQVYCTTFNCFRMFPWRTRPICGYRVLMLRPYDLEMPASSYDRVQDNSRHFSEANHIFLPVHPVKSRNKNFRVGLLHCTKRCWTCECLCSGYERSGLSEQFHNNGTMVSLPIERSGSQQYLHGCMYPCPNPLGGFGRVRVKYDNAVS